MLVLTISFNYYWMVHNFGFTASHIFDVSVILHRFYLLYIVKGCKMRKKGNRCNGNILKDFIFDVKLLEI